MQPSFKCPTITSAEYRYYKDIIDAYESTADQYDHAGLLNAVAGDDHLCARLLELMVLRNARYTMEPAAVEALALRGHPLAITWAAKLHQGEWARIPTLHGEPIYEYAADAILAAGGASPSMRETMVVAEQSGKISQSRLIQILTLPSMGNSDNVYRIGQCVFNQFRLGKRTVVEIAQEAVAAIERGQQEIRRLAAGTSAEVTEGRYVLHVNRRGLHAIPTVASLPEFLLNEDQTQGTIREIRCCVDAQGNLRYKLEDRIFYGITVAP